LRVRSCTAVDQGHSVTLKERYDDDTKTFVGLEADLLPEESFVALLAAVRLVYMHREPANFGHVHQILHQHGGPEIQVAVRDLYSTWKAVLSSGGKAWIGSEEYTARRMFDTWMNAAVLHQDKKRLEAYELLRLADDAFAPWVVHGMVLRLAGCIIDMDDLVASFLGEEPLPRIQPRTSSGRNS